MENLWKKEHEKECRFSLYLIGNTLISLILISYLIQSCNFAPRTQKITLTYWADANKMHYERLTGVILLEQNPRLKVYATVTNTSDYGGVFKFHAQLSSLGNTIEFNQEKFIAAGATVDFVQAKEINPYSFKTDIHVVEWKIIAPTKIIQLK